MHIPFLSWFPDLLASVGFPFHLSLMGRVLILLLPVIPADGTIQAQYLTWMGE